MTEEERKEWMEKQKEESSFFYRVIMIRLAKESKAGGSNDYGAASRHRYSLSRPNEHQGCSCLDSLRLGAVQRGAPTRFVP